jgi:hypothetical protein
MAADLTLYKTNLTAQRDQIREAIQSDAANGGSNVDALVRQAAALTAAIAELTAIGV